MNNFIENETQLVINLKKAKQELKDFYTECIEDETLDIISVLSHMNVPQFANFLTDYLIENEIELNHRLQEVIYVIGKNFYNVILEDEDVAGDYIIEYFLQGPNLNDYCMEIIETIKNLSLDQVKNAFTSNISVHTKYRAELIVYRDDLDEEFIKEAIINNDVCLYDTIFFANMCLNYADLLDARCNYLFSLQSKPSDSLMQSFFDEIFDPSNIL
jgi:hypothetical protein